MEKICVDFDPAEVEECVASEGVKEPAAQSAQNRFDLVAGKTVAEILGEIVWLMTQDPPLAEN